MKQVGTISGIVASNAETRPNGNAVLSLKSHALTYEALFEHISDTVSALNAIGLTRNDRLAVVLPNGPEMATAFCAISSGFSCAPLNPSFQATEFDFYLSDLKAKAVIVQAGFDSPVRDVATRLGVSVLELHPESSRSGLFSLSHEIETLKKRDPPDFAGPLDEALVLHTSGTTSRPKLVPLSHGNLVASAVNISESLALSDRDICMNVMPLFHIHGLMACVLASFQSGASVVCTPGFSAPSFLEQLSRTGATWYSAVPTMHQAIVGRVQANPSSTNAINLRFIRSSSASLPPTVMSDLEQAFGVPVIESYGMTEASHQMASNPLPPLQRKPGTVGLAAGPEVSVMDEDGVIVGADQVGEIVIRGNNVTVGYAGNPQANAAAFTNGWFRTGDQGYLDEDGYLTITGRLKEIINRGGEKISPREIDEVLLAHPSVRQAVTFALPDQNTGEEVAAAVVLEAGNKVGERELQDFVAERLVDFKIPRRVVFLDEIPKGPTGKLRRIGLSDQLDIRGELPRESLNVRVGDTGDPDTDTEKAMIAIWKNVLKLEQIGLDDSYLSLGGDSILVAQILNRVESVLGVRLSIIDFFGLATVRRLSKRVDEIANDARDSAQTELVS
ncbi:MAG: acyl--CoA ligase [Rhodothermia bacterium]|nr:MAG: acyl--CoA ligase [Rhodothermia bacterium]